MVVDRRPGRRRCPRLRSSSPGSRSSAGVRQGSRGRHRDRAARRDARPDHARRRRRDREGEPPIDARERRPRGIPNPRRGAGPTRRGTRVKSTDRKPSGAGRLAGAAALALPPAAVAVNAEPPADGARQGRLRHRQHGDQPLGRLRGRRVRRGPGHREQARLQGRLQELNEEPRWQGFGNGRRRRDRELGPPGPREEVRRQTRRSPVDVGPNGNEGIIGWFVPPWMVEKYPDIPD